MLGNGINRGAYGTLVFSRFIYAINFYNIASLFSFIAIDLREGVYGLGLVNSSFLIGMGAFQLPGGLMAAKLGPKKTLACGTLIASTSALLSGLTGDLTQLNLLRFLVGTGMALTTPSSVALVARYYRKGSEGVGIGLFWAAFSLGGLVGIFGWTILATDIGWRLSLIGSGTLGIFTGGLLLLLVPKDSVSSHFRLEYREFLKIIANRQLLILGIVMLGFFVGNSLVSNFIVFYLEDFVGVRPQSAAAIGSLVFLSQMAFSPLGGRIYDRTKRPKMLLLFAGFVIAGAVAASSLRSVYGAIISVIGSGGINGMATTIGFSAARDINTAPKEYESFAVSLFNDIPFVGSVWSPIAFSLIAANYDYSSAWLAASMFALVLILPVLMLRDHLGSSRESAQPLSE